MKKIALCIVVVMLMLVSCGKIGNENYSAETIFQNTVDTTDVDFTPSSEIWEVYSVSKNVYLGTVISSHFFENDEDKTIEYFTIKVEEVFKGDYNVGDIVSEEYTKSNFGMTIINDTVRESLLGEYNRYLFMLGIDDSLDTENVENIRNWSYCSAIELGGPMLYWDTILSSMRNVSYYDLIHIYMFDTERQLLDSIGETSSSENNIRKYCELADNIYYGEILESTEIGVYSYYTGREGFQGFKKVYKNKVRVMNVYKGDYKPGDIVEDISLKDYGYAPTENGFTQKIPLKIPYMEPELEHRSKYAFFMTGQYYEKLFLENILE